MRMLLARQSADGFLDRKLLNSTKQAVRAARFMAWSYPIERPHALREAGEVALLQSRQEKAVRFYKASLLEAERLEMPPEAAKTSERMDEVQKAIRA